MSENNDKVPELTNGEFDSFIKEGVVLIDFFADSAQLRAVKGDDAHRHPGIQLERVASLNDLLRCCDLTIDPDLTAAEDIGLCLCRHRRQQGFDPIA